MYLRVQLLTKKQWIKFKQSWEKALVVKGIQQGDRVKSKSHVKFQGDINVIN